MLHEDFAKTLHEPCALCAVPVSHIAGKSGVCNENVLPTQFLSNHRDYHQVIRRYRLVRSPRTRSVTPLKNHPCIRCTATSWNIQSQKIHNNRTFITIGSLAVRRIVDTIVLFFASAGLQLTMIPQLTNPFETWIMKNFGFPFSFGQYSLLNLLNKFYLKHRNQQIQLTWVCLAPNPALCSRRK